MRKGTLTSSDRSPFLASEDADPLLCFDSDWEYKNHMNKNIWIKNGKIMNVYKYSSGYRTGQSCTGDSYQLIWRTKWQMRVNIFSCSSKGLWDDLDAEWQQTTRLWLVSQHMSHCITLHLSAILGGSYLATLSVASTNHVGKVTQQNKSVVDNRM